MPKQQMPSELCSYNVYTGIVQISIQRGLSKLNSEPGTDSNVFANLAVFDLPPNANIKLGTFSCDLSAYRQKDTRRHFTCDTGDIILVVVDDQKKPRYFYNHVTESYGIFKFWSAYKTGNWKQNVGLYIIFLVLIMIALCITFGTENTFFSNVCFLIAYLLPIVPYVAAQVNYAYHISFIEWVILSCAPAQSQQSALQTQGI